MKKAQSFLRTLQKCNLAKRIVRKENPVNLESFKSNLLAEMSDLKDLSRKSILLIHERNQIDNCLKSLSESEITDFKAISIL
jgi:hypothetical protein